MSKFFCISYATAVGAALAALVVLVLGVLLNAGFAVQAVA
jgi:hypothetical protein